MISLPHLLTTARRFVDGVCAIPRFASMERLEEIREAYRKATQIRSELGIDETGLIQQLAAEREAHAKTREYFVDQMRASLSAVGMPEVSIARWIDNEQIESDCLTSRDHDIIVQINARQSAERELSAARADLDALTGAVVEFRENIQVFADSLRGDKPSAGHVDACDYTIGILDKITIPESLAAWKAREGGKSDGL